ncbi:hypothetical protein HPB50_007775 [Hyalomma asiaticum]|uniref:Uncharacterized protein n=1 Tax=Hyalomma asiaticum TaxID=266040 RepID=A0ACB7RTI6_HYAAI|nr:hypothetical protein HPB50_007775 [Hyalomma asiaticum]
MGYCVLNAQAAKILGNKKGKLVCKHTAQALWSSSVLATRGVSGNVAPKKRALGELPKQQPTPQKVDVADAKAARNQSARGSVPTEYIGDLGATRLQRHRAASVETRRVNIPALHRQMALTSSVAIAVMSGSSDSPPSPAQSVLLTMCDGNEPSPVSPEDAGTAGSVGTACSDTLHSHGYLVVPVYDANEQEEEHDEVIDSGMWKEVCQQLDVDSGASFED